MCIKKILFFIFCINVIAINSSMAVLSDGFFRKKYKFSESSLDETKALNYIICRGENPQEMFEYMWREATLGNEKVQLKLLLLFSNESFYKKAKTRLSDLLESDTAYSLNALIEIGITQKKPWAFYEKAKIENNPKEKFILLNEALNFIMLWEETQELYVKIQEERNKFSYVIVQECRFLQPEFSEKDNKKIDRFVKDCTDLKNGGFLFFLYQQLKEMDKKNSYYAQACLKAACALNNISACTERGDIYYLNGQNQEAVEYYRKAAEYGYISAMLNLGAIILEEEFKLASFDVNISEGFKWILKAAEGGEIPAMYCAAHWLKKVHKVQKIQIDEQKLFNFLYEAAMRGHVDSMIKLAKMYQNGFNHNEPNLTETIYWLLKAIEQNNPDAMYKYGLLLKKGFLDQEPNLVEGHCWIQKAASLELEIAMNYLAGWYMGWVKGEEQNLNYKKAYEWFFKASQIDDLAKFNMGIMALRGFGFKKPKKGLAIQFLSESAKNNQTRSMIVLAELYLKEAEHINNKSKKQQKYKEAASLLSKAVSYGYFDNLLKPVIQKNYPTKIRFRFTIPNLYNINQILNLGHLYNEGYVDGTQNKKEAFKYFLCAAENNNVYAMECVANLFVEGFNGQESNIKEAAYWYAQAANNNCASSMVKLAKLYIFEPFFSTNSHYLQEAVFWLRKAESMDEADAHTYLEMCEKLLSESSNTSSNAADTTLEDLAAIQTDIQFCYCESGELVTPNDVTADYVQEDDHITFEENIIDDIELPESPELPETTPLKEISRNPKYIRHTLRKIAQLKKEQQNLKNDTNQVRSLSATNNFIVQKLLDKNSKNINIGYSELVKLFNDPFFENQVNVHPTKSGCIISAKNYKTLQHKTTSTHKKHGQTYSGLNRSFAKELVDILEIFGLH